MSDIRIPVILTVSQINQALAIIGKQPYEDVHALVHAIKTQGDAGVENAKEQAIRQMLDARKIEEAGS